MFAVDGDSALWVRVTLAGGVVAGGGRMVVLIYYLSAPMLMLSPDCRVKVSVVWGLGSRVVTGNRSVR